MITLESQIKEVRRELAMRAAFYPKQIAKKKMTFERAQELFQIMEQVLLTLETLQPNLFDEKL